MTRITFPNQNASHRRADLAMMCPFDIRYGILAEA